MLRSCRSRAARTAGSVLSVAPKSRSNTTRGLFSDIRGSVGVNHESVLLYAQLYPDVARSDEAVVVHLQLQRRELRVALEGARGDLVHRDAALDD
jgi:hypothetical protein